MISIGMNDDPIFQDMVIETSRYLHDEKNDNKQNMLRVTKALIVFLELQHPLCFHELTFAVETTTTVAE